MRKRVQKAVLGVAALAALAAGGATLANAGSTPAKAPAADTDHVQSGDQFAPDTGSERPDAADKSGAGEQPDAPGADKETARATTARVATPMKPARAARRAPRARTRRKRSPGAARG